MVQQNFKPTTPNIVAIVPPFNYLGVEHVNAIEGISFSLLLVFDLAK